MATMNRLLAPGAAPVIGRMFEVGADEAAAAPAQWPAVATAPASPAAPLPPETARSPLPFIGVVVAFHPGASICVSRRLSLRHDLYLADHHFVHAPGVKPLADCFPVLPLTVSLEAMAQTAACLAPGQGLLGFEGVTARRWIALEDGETLDLRIEAQVLEQPAPDGRRRVSVQVFTGAIGAAAVDATVCFGTHHSPAQPALEPLADGELHEAASLYKERHLFHGPRFQVLDGNLRVGAGGVSATLRARAADDWFAGEREPQLLTDAAMLDTVGQLAAVWSMQAGRSAFPIGLERLELHGPTPMPGARLPVRLQVVNQQFRILVTDVEVGDGKGGLWLRIGGWKSWQFDWAPQLVAFQRKPAQTLLSQECALPDAGLTCRCVAAATVKGFDLALLARHYLHGSEWQAFCTKAAVPARQLDWLLGRIAAKDAARAWSGQSGLHPAAFAIVNNRAGQPAVSYWPPDWPVPHISIAHAAGQAIGLASGAEAGVDIEAVVARDAHCVARFCTPSELRMLDAAPEADRVAWVTRLWCAKEAFGKRLGTGVAGSPLRFEAQELAPDFSLPMRHATSGVETRVRTVREGEFVIAFDIANA